MGKVILSLYVLLSFLIFLLGSATMYSIYLKVGSLPTQLYLVVVMLGFMALVSVFVSVRLKSRVWISDYSTAGKLAFFVSVGAMLTLGLYMGVKLSDAFNFPILWQKLSLALFFAILPPFSVIVMFLFLPFGRTEPKS
ncbi:hypothetical protein [Hydrogenivirga sp. 128-5-R1-1]|uniref:hypothetical protein n=1 Tax=Hydrogenivirga sp. 128-5-R1-1 TaxID=392423 RepID=UPI00015EF784|nr:hypothetical protein [Hydrogenivirga sp. 128-5-R1-1]EDP75686.1 hypothetical protein HG1285_17020 [Hydrogenivirga sp. 128-5-R1-1]